MRYTSLIILILIGACSTKEKQHTTVEDYVAAVEAAKEMSSDSAKTEIPTTLTSLSYQAGVYSYNMKVGLDKTYLTGVYQHGYYDGARKLGCSFYFYSDLSKTGEDVKPVFMVLPIKTEKKYEGEITMKDSVLNIRIKAFDEDYCYDPQLGRPMDNMIFKLKEEKKWIAWGIANSEKVYFYSEPKDELKGKTYVIKGAALLITNRKEGWYEVVYQGANGSSTKGWVKTSDVFMPFEEQIFNPML